jgi:hypothetical protein
MSLDLVPHWRSIWQNKAPLRVVCFSWLAALRKILTMDNLFFLEKKKDYPWLKSSLRIILESCMLSWLIGAICVRRVGSQWITFYYIVR